MQFEYKCSGTCSQYIHFTIEDGKVHSVQYLGGCNGNLKGISALVEGMDVDEVISRLEGTTCGSKNTSCPDQLSRALKEAKKSM
ncbi:MAG: TIGR03905 family TSCPD domain-containing protein [Ruminococcaceae bacterium]|nr:TIGR03905 family TSCPD domain-containing protein [Oscillospiraceae bacterium]